jgi:hypothetical protein
VDRLRLGGRLDRRGWLLDCDRRDALDSPAHRANVETRKDDESQKQVNARNGSRGSRLFAAIGCSSITGHVPSFDRMNRFRQTAWRVVGSTRRWIATLN